MTTTSHLEMFKRSLVLPVAIGFLLAANGVSRAAPIFSQTPPSNVNAFASDVDFGFRQADDFCAGSGGDGPQRDLAGCLFPCRHAPVPHGLRADEFSPTRGASPVSR